MKITKSQLKQIIKEEIKKASIKEDYDQSNVYAYVKTLGDGGVIIREDSAEEAKEEGEMYGEVQAVFVAKILEGEL
tara:strand:- start:152 stop:379 length:228 start_codon:yes stop_codon:yes gene_type:complete